MLRKSLVALLLTLAVALTATPSLAQSTPSLTHLTIQLSWLPTVEFAGFYEAVDRGYYAAEGLEVEFISGGFDAKGDIIVPQDTVLNQKADFGITGSDAILTERAAGKPLVGLAAIYQRNPLAFMSLASANIRTPADLVGKRIRVEPGTGTDLNLSALLSSQNIPRSKIVEVKIDDPTVEPLIKGELDVIPVFITNEPILMKARKIDFNLILPSDYGIDVYSNTIFTTEGTIKDKPQIVEKFLRATFKGYTTALTDVKHAAELAVAQNKDLILENEQASMEASVPLIKVPNSQPGIMKLDQWELTQSILLEQGLLKEKIDVSKAFDGTILAKIYGIK